jgi:hypothetical protein
LLDAIRFEKGINAEKDMGQKMPQKPIIMKSHLHIGQFITCTGEIDKPGQFNQDEWNITPSWTSYGRRLPY